MARASMVGIDLGSWKCRATALRESDHSMTTVSVDSLVAEGPDGSLVAGPTALVSAGVETIRLQPARLSGHLETRLGERLVDNREVAAAVMRQLLDMTEAQLGERPSAAVLALPLSPAALPASFLAELSQLVGLEVMRVIGPATAAAVALGWESSEDEGAGHLALLDIGHGKTSAASAELGDGIIEMIRTTVDKTLGGSRWDQRIVELLERMIVRPGFQYFGEHEAVLDRLSAMAVEAKHALSAAPSTAVQARTVGRVGDEYIDLDTSLTRLDVE